MTSISIDYARDRSRFNPDHKHAYMVSIEREDFTVRGFRSAETYADIAARFELAIEELREISTRKKPVEHCADCGASIRRSRIIQVWYYVMSGEDVLFERTSHVLTIEHAIQRIESALPRLRDLAATEQRRCKTCGRVALKTSTSLKL